MKSAEPGPHNMTVNALIPGLIDTAVTRHEERYAPVLETPASADRNGKGRASGARDSRHQDTGDGSHNTTQ